MTRNYSRADLYSGVPLRDMMEQLLNDARVMSARGRTGQQTQRSSEGGAMEAPVNMYESAAELIVVLPLPGVSPNDIQVDVLGTQLHVRTEARRDEPHAEVGADGGAQGEGDHTRRWLQHEFRIGPYERTVELPYSVDADRTNATYEHGLLTLRFPRPAADQPRRIQLGGLQQGSPSGQGQSNSGGQRQSGTSAER